MKLLIFLALQAVADAQTTFGGVPVYNYEQSIFSGEEEKREWIIMSKRHKPTSAAQSTCSDASECIASGNPDEGGFGYTTVKATAKEMEELAYKHAEDLEFIEPSMPIQAFDLDFDFKLEEHDYNIQPVTNLSFLQEPTRLWGLDRIDDQSGLDGDYTPPGNGKGVHVYVLDTGIKTEHTEFEGRAIPLLDSTTGRLVICNPSDHTCSQDDKIGHGTHCAGTVGGRRVGVAKGVTLYSGKVLGPRGGSTAGIIAAMDHVVRNVKKPAIMSMSLGGPGKSNAFRTAIDEATAAGITVVVAAGNMNNDACNLSPAFVPNAITVGATDDQDARAVFSSYGGCLDIYAPGVQILSAYHTSNEAYTKMDGTSMACPHVSGAAALLLEKNNRMSPADINAKLKGMALPDIITDAKPRSPNLLLNVGSGKGGKPKPTSKPGCPPCKCDESRRRGGKGGGKGGRRRRKN